MIRRRKKMIFGLLVVFVLVLLVLLINVKSIHEDDLDKWHRESDERLRKRKAGVNVIVGHYIGSGLFGNASKDLINENSFNPVSGEGENGKPVVVPSKDVLKMQQVFQVNRFNLMASDRMPLNRTVPDVRKEKCRTRVYKTKSLPDTSIIIVFHNEAWSVLLRTVWSVINRSPRHLIKEILLVDDFSDRKFLGKALEKYVSLLPIPTKVLRLPERSGLVAARLLGAKVAKGETLTFLDAHCECSPGWLEPLLDRIRLDRKKVPCPVIDIISDDNFSYIKSFEMHWGAFNWQLHFRWFALETSELKKRQTDITIPFQTPAMAGGLFSIDREYFFEIGSYDEEMKIWGGDNLEISFRIWQCGGEIEIVPCSHVGHLFRKSSPYTFPGGVGQVLSKNLARVALVWMDEWSEFFFKFNPDANAVRDKEDVDKRLQLRNQLECNSFEWYLTNIWPQHFLPMDNRFFGKIILDKDVKSSEKYKEYLKEKFPLKYQNSWKSLIEISNENLNDFHDLIPEVDYKNQYCLNRPQQSGIQSQQPYGQASAEICENQSVNLLQQMFVVTESGKILSDENLCLDASEVPSKRNQTMVRLITCTETQRQLWDYNWNSCKLIHRPTGFCLTALDDQKLVIQKCQTSKTTQTWLFLPFPWK